MNDEEAAVAIQHKNDTIKQTIIETIEAPRLENIIVRDSVAFKESRIIYERRISKKNADAAVQMPLSTYKISINESVLELFVTENCVDSTSVDRITEDRIKSYIDKLTHVEENDYDLGSFERNIRTVSMEQPSLGVNLEKQVWRASNFRQGLALPEVFDYAEKMWL